MTQSIDCFKAYDVRGRIPDELNDDVVYRIGRAYADFLTPKRVVVGRDIRQSSAELCDALSRGLTDGGADWVGVTKSGPFVIAGVTVSPDFQLQATIPNDSSLDGAKVNLQMWWLSQVGLPIFQLSNGVQFVGGAAKPK